MGYDDDWVTDIELATATTTASRSRRRRCLTCLPAGFWRSLRDADKNYYIVDTRINYDAFVLTLHIKRYNCNVAKEFV